jgi:3-phenylpropionate/cinnamic acid dioxygenase small subunit
MDIEATLRALVDRQQIVDTLYRYASTIDAKDYPRLRSLFVDDAVAQYAGAEPIHGADAIVAWIDSMTLDRAWQHHLVNVYHVDFEGPDQARTLTYHTSHQTTTADPDTVIVIVARYRDVLHRVNGGWKIAEKVMDVGWMEERHAPQAAMSEREANESLAARTGSDS